MPVRLALCDLGAPGWGEPWFPHSAVLLYSQPWYGDVGDVAFLVCLLGFTAIPNIEMIQCYHLFSFLFDIDELASRSLSLSAGVFVCFVCCLCVFCLVVFCVWFGFVCGFFSSLGL